LSYPPHVEIPETHKVGAPSVVVNAAQNILQPQQGNVKVDLADGDQLTVGTLEDGFTLVSFTKKDGTRLDLKVQASDGNGVGLHYVDSNGLQYAYYSEGDFVIPDLKKGAGGNLVAVPGVVKPTKEASAKGSYRGSWATYIRKDKNNGLGSLSIPALRLNLNLNKLHGDFVKKTEIKLRKVDENGRCQTPEEIAAKIKELEDEKAAKKKVREEAEKKKKEEEEKK